EGQAGAPERPVVEGGRQEVLDGPGLQEQRRPAARRVQGPVGEGPRRRDVRGQEGQARRADQDPVRLLRLRRDRHHVGLPAVVRQRQVVDQAAAGPAAPAEGADGIRHQLPQPVEEQDRLPQGLRHRRLQERAEVEVVDDLHDEHHAVERDHRWGTRRVRRGPGRHVAAAVAALDGLTRRLRRECPWDREQDERSIVPHTVEEAYELADAANAGDDAKLRDELGDVLFQVHFLSLLLEERGAGDMAQVAEHVRQKLIRRHPHVFGEVEAETAGEVLRNWDEIKRSEPGREEGIFGEVPENLPALLHARKVQRRAASSGFDFDRVPYDAVSGELEELEAAGTERDAAFHEVGDLLFAAVSVARKLRVDPELALRAASGRFRGRVEAASERAASEGRNWNDLSPNDKLAYYRQVVDGPDARAHFKGT